MRRGNGFVLADETRAGSADVLAATLAWAFKLEQINKAMKRYLSI
jgi:hypothetical protein